LGDDPDNCFHPTVAMIQKHKRLLLLIASAILTLSLASCGTISGIGKDLSTGGRALSKAAS